MILFIHPNGRLLHGPNIVFLQDLKLDGTGADAAGPCSHDNIAGALLGRGQRDNLTLTAPLGDKQAVGAVDKHTDQILLRGAEIFASNGYFGAGEALPWRHTGYDRGSRHFCLPIAACAFGLNCPFDVKHEIMSLIIQPLI